MATLTNKELEINKNTKKGIEKRIFYFCAICIVVFSIFYWFLKKRADSSPSVIHASGTFEAVEVHIASEQNGKVVEIMVDEGDSFNAGDPLFRLDDSMLRMQEKEANAAFEVAKVNADLAHANANAQILPIQQNLDDLYRDASLRKANAEKALAAADRAVREATYQLDNYIIPIYMKGMTTSQAIQVMKERLDQARLRFEPYKFESVFNDTRKDLKEALDNAQSTYDAAIRRQELEAALTKALSEKQKALDELNELKNGPRESEVDTLISQVDAIQLMPKQADAALEQAKTSLEMIQYELTKTVIYAPDEGVVLSRGIEVGDVVQAGISVMIIGKLNLLNLVVYVPEDQYGAISLGEIVQVHVDSFPGKDFDATVKYISDQAEFTPRNVQTVEARKTTVYAVHLKVNNDQLQLKPGMPADVDFPGLLK